MNLDEALYTFIEESRELLSAMEDSLLRVEHEASPDDSINAIFRAAHTIKGSAGLFGLETVVAFTHVAESLLDEVRAGAVPLTTSLVQLLLNCCDHMQGLIDAVEAKADLHAPDLQQHGQLLMQALESFRSAAPVPPSTLLPKATSSSMAQPPSAPDTAASFADSAAADPAWHIAVQFGPTVMQNGMDPLSFLRYLHTLGQVSNTQTLHNSVPPLDAIDAEQCYLGFSLDIRTTASQQTLEDVFEFVRDDCALNISPQIGRAHV